MPITRRQVLAGTSAVAVAGTVGAGGLVWSWYDNPADQPLLALSEAERQFLNAVGEAWAPPGGDPPLSGAEADVGAMIDRVVATMSDAQRKGFKLLLHGLDTLVVPTHRTTFTRLSLAEREEVLRGWVHSPLFLMRQAASAVTVLVALAWTEHPAVAPTFRQYYRCGFGQ